MARRRHLRCVALAGPIAGGVDPAGQWGRSRPPRPWLRRGPSGSACGRLPALRPRCGRFRSRCRGAARADRSPRRRPPPAVPFCLCGRGRSGRDLRAHPRCRENDRRGSTRSAPRRRCHIRHAERHTLVALLDGDRGRTRARGPPPGIHDPDLFIDPSRLYARFARHGISLSTWGLRPAAIDYLRFLVSPQRPVRFVRTKSVAGLYQGVGRKDPSWTL